MDFADRLKKEMSEGVVRAILDDAGYRVIDTGIERVLREVACMSEVEYNALGLSGALRRLPDLMVMDRDQKQSHLIEVRYRTYWDRQVLFDLREQVSVYHRLVLVTINANPPNERRMLGQPALHLRCCRLRLGDSGPQVELARRDSDGGGAQWVELGEVNNEHLWWKLRPLQDVFTQVHERRDSRSLTKAIQALAGIIA